VRSTGREPLAAAWRALPSGTSEICFTHDPVMPKMKTHSGAKKRFKLTANGKVKARHAFSSHILEKKSPKYKRNLASPLILSDHDAPRVKTLLGAKKS
jgi:large subunit ribosomal protein L35